MADLSAGLAALDEQVAVYRDRLVRELGVPPEAAPRLATAIAEDVAKLDEEKRRRIRDEQQIPFKDRLVELVAFQGFMDLAQKRRASPYVVRAQVIVQNYVCFVYLGEACFRELRRVLPSRSAAHRCSTFLTDNPVRAFRNALAHANWRYLPGFSGLEFWARKGAGLDEPVVRWQVSQDDLDYWQMLARCTGYATFLSL